jgi:transposase-like protein
MRTRRQFTAEFKAQRVLAVLSGRKTAAAVCREYQLKPDLLTRWKADFVTRAAQVFAGKAVQSMMYEHIGHRLY